MSWNSRHSASNAPTSPVRLNIGLDALGVIADEVSYSVRLVERAVVPHFDAVVRRHPLPPRRRGRLFCHFSPPLRHNRLSNEGGVLTVQNAVPFLGFAHDCVGVRVGTAPRRAPEARAELPPRPSVPVAALGHLEPYRSPLVRDGGFRPDVESEARQDPVRGAAAFTAREVVRTEGRPVSCDR